MNPTMFAAYEELWIARRLAGRAALHPGLDDVYDAAETPRSVRGEVAILDEASARRYLEIVRERSLGALAASDLGEDAVPPARGGFIFEMVAEHEAQHTETVRQALQTRLPGGDPRRRRSVGRGLPGLDVHGVAGEFDRHLPGVPARERSGQRRVAFLGEAIGNLEPCARTPFLASVAELMEPGDLLLVGTDLGGDPRGIQPAHAAAEGVTAEFNLNVLRVLNRQLDADFDLDAFAHVAIYDPGPPWITMRLCSLADQVARVGVLDKDVASAEGEEMRTEISCTFTRPAVQAMYADAGLALEEWHEDDRGWFAVSLARRHQCLESQVAWRFPALPTLGRPPRSDRRRPRQPR